MLLLPILLRLLLTLTLTLTLTLLLLDYTFCCIITVCSTAVVVVFRNFFRDRHTLRTHRRGAYTYAVQPVVVMLQVV